MISDQDYGYIKREIRQLMGVDLDCYKSPQMQRRLKTFLIRSGHSAWRSFFNAVRNDPVALGQLKDYLTINVTSFFRDLEKYEHLQKSILPDLLKGRPKLRVWSAGCSRGHEPYTLAIILAELSGAYRQHEMLATDIDHSALGWAQAGGPYSADDVSNVAAALLDRYFKRQPDGYYVNDLVRRRVTFRYHNLLSDPFENGLDLIICRNVVIYFTAEVKDQLYRRFCAALRPGGVLFVGGTEIVPRAMEIGLQSAGIGFYRRNGAL